MIYCVLICSIHFFIHEIMCYYVLLLSKFENCQNIDKILSTFLKLLSNLVLNMFYIIKMKQLKFE
jgi:hypothetical protein